MVLVALLVANRQQTMENVIKRLFSGSGKKISVVSDIHKIKDLNTHLQLLDESGTDIAFVRVWDAEGVCELCSGVFFDVVIYDNMAGEAMHCRQLAKNIHPKTIVISNGDDAVVPDFMEGTKTCMIAYGLGQKCSVIPSAIDVGQDLRLNVCVQRSFLTLDGKEVEEGEIVVELDGGNCNVYDVLAATVVRLVLD